MSYASNSDVSVEKSRAELETILARYGASSFGYMSTEAKAIVAFQAHGKAVKFILPLPGRGDFKLGFRTYLGRRVIGSDYERSPEAIQKLWEQACRSRWRALCLCVKAKLEAVEVGITSFEQEFLAHFVLPNGQTFGDYAIPKIEAATKSGKMPTMALME